MNAAVFSLKQEYFLLTALGRHFLKLFVSEKTKVQERNQRAEIDLIYELQLVISQDER